MRRLPNDVREAGMQFYHPHFFLSDVACHPARWNGFFSLLNKS
jgi:hypothetical protein